MNLWLRFAFVSSFGFRHSSLIRGFELLHSSFRHSLHRLRLPPLQVRELRARRKQSSNDEARILESNSKLKCKSSKRENAAQFRTVVNLWLRFAFVSSFGFRHSSLIRGFELLHSSFRLSLHRLRLPPLQVRELRGARRKQSSNDEARILESNSKIECRSSKRENASQFRTVVNLWLSIRICFELRISSFELDSRIRASYIRASGTPYTGCVFLRFNSENSAALVANKARMTKLESSNQTRSSNVEARNGKMQRNSESS